MGLTSVQKFVYCTVIRLQILARPATGRVPAGILFFSAKKPPAQPDEDAGSNNGDNEVCKPAKGVEAQDAGQEAANEGTDDTNDDVAKQTAVGIHDFAGNPADDGTGDEGT